MNAVLRSYVQAVCLDIRERADVVVLPPARECGLLMLSLKELHGFFVFLSRFACLERAKIPALRSLRILLARVQAVFTRPKLPDHGSLPSFNSALSSRGLSSARRLHQLVSPPVVTRTGR